MSDSKYTSEKILLSLTEILKTQHNTVDSRLDSIEKVLISQEMNLKEHMRRSDNLEALVNLIQEKDLKPLHKHVSQVEGVFKFLGLVALVLTIVSGIMKFF